ncbi:DUF4342 domain-containing protein [Candidatus Shapirobacteria bacterium]|nr:DUF4342 domain-containing protein [Candidatus Shapirobacteria bacterium]
MPTKTKTSQSSSFFNRLKGVVHEGNTRYFSVTTAEGNQIVILPLTIVILVGLIAPPFMIIALIVALVTNCSLKIEKK